MTSKRSYQDGCAAAHALDLIGERWALLVARELLLGPRRFTDLRASLPNISPNVLSQRLTELEESGIVQRRKLAPPANVWIYELSSWGQGLEPVIIQLGQWGARSPHLNPGAPLSVVSLMLSFKAMFNSSRAEGLKACYELRLGDEQFYAEVQDGQFKIERGTLQQPDVVLEMQAGTLTALVYGGLPLDEAIESGEFRYQGNRSVLERFLRLFPIPQPCLIPQ